MTVGKRQILKKMTKEKYKFGKIKLLGKRQIFKYMTVGKKTNFQKYDH
jgi:hypothetical protein